MRGDVDYWAEAVVASETVGRAGFDVGLYHAVFLLATKNYV